MRSIPGYPRFEVLLFLVILIQSTFGQAVDIPAVYATDPQSISGALDSPAIWVPEDPANSILYVTAKGSDDMELHDPINNTYLGNFGVSGVNPGQLDYPNGVVIAYNFLLSGQPVDLLFVTERNNARISVFKIPSNTFVGTFGETELTEPYGVTLYQVGSDLYVYVTENGSDEGVYIYQIVDNNGVLGAVLINYLPLNYSLESLTVDPQLQRLLVCNDGGGEVNVYSIWGDNYITTFGTSEITGDAEGIIIYDCGGDSGYVIVSDQQLLTQFEIFGRQSYHHIGTFVSTSPTETRDTDGIALTQRSLPNLPNGSFYAQSRDRQAICFDWQDIASAFNLQTVVVGGQPVQTGFSSAVFLGWNLVGLPLDMTNTHYQTLYPSSVPGSLYGFNDSYYQEETLEPGNGYWLASSQYARVHFDGDDLQSLVLDLEEGWNLIAGPSGTLAFEGIIDPDEILIEGSLFGFNGFYEPANSIMQGKGYWVACNDNGEIELNIEAARAHLSRRNKAGDGTYLSKRNETANFPELIISNSAGAEQKLYFKADLSDISAKAAPYQLPPVPPPGVGFDARFAGDKWIIGEEEALIRIQSDSFPVTMTVGNLPEDELFSYFIYELSGTDVREKYLLSNGKKFEFAASSPGKITLELQKEALKPVSLQVWPNFPNPFNPETEIRYAVPKAGKVEISIYNILGQRIKTLISETQDAGIHTVRWDGTNHLNEPVSSGVYFYRVSAGNMTRIGKMIFTD